MAQTSVGPSAPRAHLQALTSRYEDVDLLLGAALELVMRGIARAARRPRPIVRVVPTYWLSVGAVATAGQLIAVGVAVAIVGRVCHEALTHDSLGIAGIFVLPIGFVALSTGLAIMGWLIGTTRRVLAFDAMARVELVACGLLGLMLGAFLPGLVGQAWVALWLAVSAISLVVAAVPAAWRHAEVDFRVDASADLGSPACPR